MERIIDDNAGFFGRLAGKNKKAKDIARDIFLKQFEGDTETEQITEENIKFRNSPEYKEWRSKVYKRDKYTCRKCGDNKGGNLNAHHVMSFSKYPSYRLLEEFGITWCKPCHKKHHKIFGYEKGVV